MVGAKKLKRSREQAADFPVLSEPVEETAKPAQSENAEPASKRARVEAARSIFVRSLPPSATAESLTDFFSQHYPVKHATVILDPATKTSRGYGFVTFTDPDDAIDAKAKLHNHKLDGRPINLEIAEPRHRKPAAGSADAISQKEQRKAALAEARKAPKLIVRNLPWSIKKADQLSALFRAYGLVKYADLPQSKGKLKGFGFVTLRGRKNAEKALEMLNGKEIDGRTIAVDWAVDKEQWEKQQPEQVEDKDKEDTATSKQDEDQDENKNEDEDEEEDEDLRNFMKNHMENLENEDSNTEDPEEDEDEEEGDNDTPPKQLTTNNDTTLFIRNLPFSTTDADLKAHFEQFGGVRYARVVVDRATDRPAGTGFVCFYKEEDSRACLKGAPRPRAPEPSGKRSILQDEMADPQGLYTIEGRILQVSQAVSKTEATRLLETGIAARDGKDKDKRRLYLLSEGTIPASSPLHALLAPSEVKMREDSSAQRKKLIQGNPALHISLTRLAIRNIPRDVTSKDLKSLARQAVVGFAKDVKEGKREPLSKEEAARGGIDDKEAEHKRKEKGKGVVKQAKLVFENNQGSKVPEHDGAGKSRGYGFIEYSSHRWALMGLRWLNGHALKNPLGKTQRLIVEFAIENVNVVARRNDTQSRFQRGGQQNSRDRDAKSGSNAHRSGDNRANNRGPPPKGKYQGKKGAEKNDGGAEGDETPKRAVRDALEQKIIGRKRVMRKKKADVRGKK